MNTISYLSYIYSIVLCVISLIVFAITLPAVIREGNVKNGLRNYRRIFLIAGSATFALAFAATAILTSRFVLPLEVYRTFGAIVLDLFSTILLIIGVAFFQIYHYQFTPKQKGLHEQMEAVEQGRAKIVSVKRKK